MNRLYAPTLAAALLVVSTVGSSSAETQAEAKATSSFGLLHVALKGCTDTVSPSVLHIRTMEGGDRDFRTVALGITDGSIRTTAELPTGYYSLNVTGGCTTPTINEPVVVLSERARSVVLHEGTGVGMLYTGAVGLAGSLAAPAVAVYLDRPGQPSQAAIVDRGVYYFDYVVKSSASYLLRVVDTKGRRLYTQPVDLNGQRPLSLRLLDL
jgi:hypothetical protein